PHVRHHLRSCFAVLGVPVTIKTDNGPAYVSCSFHYFSQLWGLQHYTGIPHSSTGQAVIERAHKT
ncbi:POK19 protein, partial [Alcedo cyanopectus]|nr:POK19 protein [Ceyx cyanopectus]